MFEEPLFQDNILQTMYKYFSHYLSYQNWAWQFFGAMFFLYIIYKLLMYKNTIAYAPFFPTEKYYFSWKRNSDKFGIIFLLLCFGIYGWYLFFQELNFFANQDTMCAGTMDALQNGTTPYWGNNGRFSPVSFWDINIIYAITHNFALINIYIITQIIFIIYLINKLFIFIPSFSRLLCCGLLLIMPSFLGTNLISYPERMAMIFFLSSLLFLKYYGENSQKKIFLWLGILFFNLTIYTKESCILLYFGILIYSFAMNLWNEKITIKSFLHPIKSARQFPLEILIFFSMLIFSILYLIFVTAISDSVYLSIRKSSLQTLLSIYKIDLILIISSTIIYLINQKKNFILNSLLIGSIWSAFFIIYILKLTPPTHKIYYMLIPDFIAIITMIYSLKSKKILIAIISVLISIFIHNNILMYKAEEGMYYRKTSEFLLSQKEPLSIFISEYSEPYPWWDGCWAAIYKYYAPNTTIKFSTSSFNHNKTDLPFLIYWKKNPQLFHPIDYQQLPQSGDFYVIKKTDKYHEDLAVIKDIQHELVHQNKLFEVYKIK